MFCKIIRREIASHIVYEDERFIAFLDIRPLSPGHTLVIPTTHHRWVWDVPHIEEYFLVVQKIAHAQRKVFETEAIFSKIVGEEVSHAHIWIYPDPSSAVGDLKNFETNASMLKKKLEK